jgi:hypothetical protein
MDSADERARWPLAAVRRRPVVTTDPGPAVGPVTDRLRVEVRSGPMWRVAAFVVARTADGDCRPARHRAAQPLSTSAPAIRRWPASARRTGEKQVRCETAARNPCRSRTTGASSATAPSGPTRIPASTRLRSADDVNDVAGVVTRQGCPRRLTLPPWPRRRVGQNRGL